MFPCVSSFCFKNPQVSPSVARQPLQRRCVIASHASHASHGDPHCLRWFDMLYHIHREREREYTLYMHVYIYIYIHNYTTQNSIYIYIHIVLLVHLNSIWSIAVSIISMIITILPAETNFRPRWHHVLFLLRFIPTYSYPLPSDSWVTVSHG